MDIAWIAEILFPERDKDTGQPKFVVDRQTTKASVDPLKAKVDAIIESLRLRGVKVHEMEAVLRQVAEASKLAEQRKITPPVQNG